MAIIFIRSLIIFAVLLVLMRLMGKRQIGEMQPFEFVITLLIAELACIPMADISIPLVYGIVAILAVFILHQLFSVLEQKSRAAKKIISGSPSLVIDKNGVNFDELAKNNMDVDDLIEAMRAAGYFSLDELDYAIFESNGKFSAFEKSQDDKNQKSLPILLVSNGKIIDQNLQTAGLNNKTFMDKIKNDDRDLKNIVVMTVDGNGKVYIQEKNKKYEVYKTELPGGVKW